MQRRIFTHLILVCLVSWVCGNIALAQSITTGTIASIPSGAMCPGSGVSFEVDFVTSGSFNVGNTFTLELSNSSGSFTSGTTVIGTGAASPLSGTIPSGVTAGSSYKVRVKSSAPVVNGTASGTTLVILTTPAAPVATTPVAFCGANTTALTATPLASHTLTWYDDLDAVLPSAPVPTVSGTYSVTQTNAAGCVSPKKSIAVTVSPEPVMPTVTTPVELCQGVTASALTATGEVGATFNWYAAATGSTTISSTPSTAAVGSISYFVSQTVNGCESERAEIVVNVTAAPAAPTVTTPVTYCLDATAVALTATGTDLLWYTASTGGTGSSTAITPSTATAGNKSYYVSQTVGGCESPRAEIVVTTNETPAPTVASTSLSYCKDEVAPALAATGTALKWYDVATGGTAIPTPTPSTATVGVTEYYVSQTLNGCESARTKITVTVKALPAAPTVAPLALCEGVTPAALTAVGTSLKWYSAVSGGTALGAAPVPTTNVVGDKSYFVSQTVNGCEGPRAELVVTTNASPAAPTVTTPVTYCINATATALSATGSNLKWYTVSTGGTGSSTAITPSTTTAGNKSYYVSQTVGGCESPRAEVVVTTNETAAPTVTSATLSYCKDEVAPVLTATGTALKWYDVPTAGTAGAAPVPSTATVGSKDYYVSQTLNGCESARTKITVTTKAVPAAPTVAALSYCQDETTSELTATGTSLKWYSALTGGTALAAAPEPATDVVGAKSYYVSQTVNGCESTRATLVVTTKAKPVAPTVAAISYCINTTAAPLTASAYTGTLKWYEVATGGTSTATKTPLTTTAGDKSYYVTQTVNSCESSRAELVVTVNSTPKPTVAALIYCKGESVSALTATGTALKWYKAATGGTALGSAPVPQTDTVKTNNYYVTQTLNGCESERALLAVTIKALPSKPTVTDSVLNICQNATVAPLSATGTGTLKWYTVATGGTSSSTAPTPLTTTVGTTSYYVSLTSVDGCEGARKKIEVTIKDTPVKPAVTTPIDYCVGSTAAALTPSGAVYKWYTVATGGTGTTTAPTPATTKDTTMSYYVSQTQTYALNPGSLVCESPRSELKVVVNPLPSTPTVTNLLECQTRTDNNQTLSATATTGNTLQWYTVASGGTASTTTPVVNLKNVVETTYYVTQKSAKNCESKTRAPLTVRVKRLPAAPTVTSSLVYCQFVAAPALNATFESNAVANWYGTSSTGGTASTTAPTPSTATGGNTTYYVSQTLEGCEGDRSSISVTINTTPKPTTTTLLSYCQDAVAPALTATGNSLKWYRTATATEFQTTPFLPITPNVGDFYFYVTQTGAVNGCESPKEEILVKVLAKPSATISGDKSIELGQSADLKIDFTGNGPWTYKLSSGITGTTNSSPITIRVTPSTTTTYLVTEVSNECGSGLPVGSARVTVLVPTISTGTVSTSNLCAGSTFSVPFQQSGYFVPENKFNVQISRDTVSTHFYTIPTTTSGNEATATVPDTTSGGSFYIRIVGENPGFKVVGSISPVTIAIKPLPSAVLTGAKTIYAGEVAELRIDLKGDFPWTLNFNNGTKDSVFTTNSTPILVNVKPAVTTTYQVKTVFNQTCGNGKGSAAVRIQVDPILGVEPVAGGSEWLKVYPNPVQSNSTLEILGTLSPKDARWEVVDSNGKSILGKKIKTTVTTINLGNLSEGMYFLRVENGGKSAVKKIIKVN